MLVVIIYVGVKSALFWERLVQKVVVVIIMEYFRDGDVLGVFLVVFYLVGWNYYLNNGVKKSIHFGCAQWDYIERLLGVHVKLFGFL